MTTRAQQIEHIAAIIAENLLLAPAVGAAEETFAYVIVQRVNREGWTFETSGPPGHVIRHEAVVLTEAELQRAWRRAHELA